MQKKNKKQNTNNEWAKLLHMLPWLLLIPVGLLLPRLAADNQKWVENIYAGRIYPFISLWMGRINSLVGFSIAECLIFALVIALVAATIVYLIRLLSRKIHIAAFFRYIVCIGIIGGILLNLFYVMWGFNYARPTLSTLLSLPVKERSSEELEEACIRLAKEANELRAQVSEDEIGVFALEGSLEENFDKIPIAYAALGLDIPMFARRTFPAKGVISSVGLSYAGISGIFIPHTGEPNVNTDQPPLLLLSAAAHETAHYLGVAREDEANFVAFLACSYSEDPAVRYSGVMLALIHCGNKLYAADKDAYSELYATYSEGMRRDLKNHNAYWKSFEGPVEEAATNLNDNYLKFNMQEDGVKSYGMMVDLILAYFANGN